MAGSGFQWGNIEVKGGLDGVWAGNDLEDEKSRDEGEEHISESFNLISFLFTSFFNSLVKLEPFLLTTFSNFLISVSSLVLLILREECSVFKV